jgi:hypothetical protein
MSLGRLLADRFIEFIRGSLVAGSDDGPVVLVAANDRDLLKCDSTADAGLAWVDGKGLPIVVTRTGKVSTTSTTAVNATDLVLPVLSGRFYKFRFEVVCRTANAVHGIGFTVTDPGETRFACHAFMNTGGAAMDSGHITTGGTVVQFAAFGAANQDTLAVIEGIIVPSADGDLQLQFCTENAATQVSIESGSHGMLWDMSA